MLMLKALRQPAIQRLWLGQALSSVGDEIYRVGLTWLAVGLIGPDTGFLNAAQAVALMMLSVVGGKWADHWDPLETMIRVDFLRSILVLIPVVCSFFWPTSLALLVAVALVLAALGAFFDPALQTVLPKFSPDKATLQAATGLMATTIRFARMVGPAVVGLLAGIVPPIHFFTLDAFTFLISANSLRPLRTRRVRPHAPSQRRTTFAEAVFSGFRAVHSHPGMDFVLFSKSLTGGTWALAYGLGLALLVQSLAPHDTRSFGLVIAAYGVGNFAGALVFGNRNRPRPALMMFSGYVWLGLGFVLIAFSPTIPWIMFSCALTGYSGTMNEVTFFDLVQNRFAANEVTRVVRLRMATDTAAVLVLMLFSPWLFRIMSVPTVIGLCGIIWILTGVVGLFFYLQKLDTAAPAG